MSQDKINQILFVLLLSCSVINCNNKSTCSVQKIPAHVEALRYHRAKYTYIDFMYIADWIFLNMNNDIKLSIKRDIRH
jgi:hypothetical protein